MRVLWAVVVLVAVGAARADDSAADLKKLAGAWKLTAATFNGDRQSDAQIAGRRIIFEGEKMIAEVGGKRQRTLTVAIKPGDSPPQIDLTYPGRDEFAAGIYELKGETLTICYGEPGAARPTKFESIAGERRFLLILKRDKE